MTIMLKNDSQVIANTRQGKVRMGSPLRNPIVIRVAMPLWSVNDSIYGSRREKTCLGVLGFKPACSACLASKLIFRS